MKFFNWFGQSNGVILEFDHLDDASTENLIEQVEELSKYYTPIKLEELAERVKKKKRLGVASLVFRNPRKSVLLRAVPYLLDKQFPFTICLRTDCVGLNRLPLEEELDLFLKKYPGKINSETQASFLQQCVSNPDAAEAYLMKLRTEAGPIPLELADPTQFFSTWGKLLEIPKDKVSWGVNLYLSPDKVSQLENEILFMRQLLSASPTVGLIGNLQSKKVPSKTWDEASLQRISITGCVGTSQGAVTHSSEWWNLPIWRFST